VIAERSTRTCPGCAVEFTPSDPRQKYHDDRCGTAARVRKHRRLQHVEEQEELIRRADQARRFIRSNPDTDRLLALSYVVAPPGIEEAAA